jgi:hypothetical protein
MIEDVRDHEQERVLERQARNSFQANIARRKGDEAVSKVLDYVEQMLARRRSSVDRIP